MGGMYFTCISSSQLNPREGTECKHRHIKSLKDQIVYLHDSIGKNKDDKVRRNH
jgi:hypothetical protein